MVALGFDKGWGSPYTPLVSPPIEQLNNCARPFGELWGFASNKEAYVSAHPSALDVDVALRNVQTARRMLAMPTLVESLARGNEMTDWKHPTLWVYN
eukprot:12742367-Alexandrium_andersonii.AAC.1